jgi:hypothetical protein
MSTVNINIPTLVSQSITSGVTNLAPSEDAVFNALATKQATLVSGTNIKTINGNSILGSGDLDVSPDLSGFVPYTGATGNVSLGSFQLQTPQLVGGTGVTSKLTYIGSTNASPTATAVAHEWMVGNNGATTAYKTYHNGNVNIGNATNTSQRILRIGQDTAFVDIGSWVDVTSRAAIYLNQATPSFSNYTLSGASGFPTNLNAEGGQDLRFNIGGVVQGRWDTTGLYIGGNTAASAKLHVVRTSEQLRVGYDASNYYTTTVGATGGVTFDAVGSGASFTFLDPIKGTGTTSATNALVIQNSAGTNLASFRDDGLITTSFPVHISTTAISSSLLSIGNTPSVHPSITDYFNIGYQNTITSISALVIGKQSSADSQSTAVGSSALSGQQSVALGNTTNAVYRSVAIGQNVYAETAGVAIGYSAIAGYGAISLLSNAQGSYSIGIYGNTTGDLSQAIGLYTNATALRSMAVGVGFDSANPLLVSTAGLYGIGVYSTVPTLTISSGGGVGGFGAVGVGVGDAAIATDALLELKSTTKAFLLMRMTTTQRDAITATAGMQIYNTTTDKFQGYAGGAWVDLH